jgi:hypothetical protein
MPNSGITIWGNNTITNLDDYTNFGCNLESYLTDILSEELSKEIDKQIIERIFGDKFRQEEARRKLRELRNNKIRDLFGDDFIST